MEYFSIVGTGMGLKEYMLPEAIEAIEKADILVGGARNLEPWDYLDKEKYIIKNNLKEIMEIIREKYPHKNLVVLVSGDPGFYSLLNYISRNFNRKELKIIPGISSMQMAFARAGLSWHDAKLLNLHGRNLDTLNEHLECDKIGMLTDPVNNPIKICEHLINQNSRNFTVFICVNLGYNNEDILEFKLYDFQEIKIDPDLPAVMILLGEE